MVQMAPVSSGQLPADLTAADDALHRRSFDCLRDSTSVGQNKTQTLVRKWVKVLYIHCCLLQSANNFNKTREHSSPTTAARCNSTVKVSRNRTVLWLEINRFTQTYFLGQERPASNCRNQGSSCMFPFHGTQ